MPLISEMTTALKASPLAGLFLRGLGVSAGGGGGKSVSIGAQSLQFVSSTNTLNYVSTSTTVADLVDSNMSVIAIVTANDWSDGSTQPIVGNIGNSAGWVFAIRDLSGVPNLWFYWLDSGSPRSLITDISAVVVNGQPSFFMVDFDYMTTIGEVSIRFYHSIDGNEWTLLDTQTVTAGGLDNASDSIRISAQVNSSPASFRPPFSGLIHLVEIHDDVQGSSLVAKFDPDDFTLGDTTGNSALNLETGLTWLLSGDAEIIVSP